jgi:hypothetical protein
MYAPPQTLPLPKVINLLTDRKEERDVGAYNSWVAEPVVKIVGEFEASLKQYPPIKLGTRTPTLRRSQLPGRKRMGSMSLSGQTRRTQREQMSSGSPLKANIAQ